MEKLAKVLIVDDNKNNIQVLGNVLREEGYLIGFATNGEQALTILRRKPDFDIILLDINMPVMDGFDTCRAIQKDDQLREIPVIFLTAYTEMDHIVTGFELGAKDYITKPFNPTELLARVRTHIELKKNKDKLNTVNIWLEKKVAERTLELEKANQELLRAREELEVLDRAKTEFLQLLSHEIRTPLNGIIVSLNLLKDANLTEEDQELFDILDQSVNRLEQFSYKALDIMELRSQKTNNQESTSIRLSLFFEKLVKKYSNELQAKNAGVEMVVEPPGISVFAQEYYLDKCLSYLLENAIFHAPHETTIRITATKNPEGIVLCLDDEGPGFPEKVLSSPLTPFLFNKREDGKAGLGLYFTQLVMKMHHGIFRYGNNMKNGAHIELIFPETFKIAHFEDSAVFTS